MTKHLLINAAMSPTYATLTGNRGNEIHGGPCNLPPNVPSSISEIKLGINKGKCQLYDLSVGRDRVC